MFRSSLCKQTKIDADSKEEQNKIPLSSLIKVNNRVLFTHVSSTHANLLKQKEVFT